jgi:hypothetical protein
MLHRFYLTTWADGFMQHTRPKKELFVKNFKYQKSLPNQSEMLKTKKGNCWKNSVITLAESTYTVKYLLVR